MSLPKFTTIPAQINTTHYTSYLPLIFILIATYGHILIQPVIVHRILMQIAHTLVPSLRIEFQELLLALLLLRLHKLNLGVSRLTGYLVGASGLLLEGLVRAAAGCFLAHFDI